MTAPEPRRPQGGLTKGQERALSPLSAGMFLSLFAPLVLLFPDFPLRYPMCGAFVAVIGLTDTFGTSCPPTGWPGFVSRVALVNLAILAAALLVAGIQLAAGWSEPEWVGVAVGMGATIPVAWLATARIIRVMNRRGDAGRDDGESET